MNKKYKLKRIKCARVFSGGGGEAHFLGKKTPPSTRLATGLY